MADVVSLLDRPVYLYSEIDHIVGLRPGTARRWINGYSRAGTEYEPIVRIHRTDSEWATWGEFVETRILAEYRDQQVPTIKLRGAMQGLRKMFGLNYPLAHLRPYLAAAAGELAIERQAVDPDDEAGLMQLRTKQLLLAEPGRSVMEQASLALDEHGESYASELVPDPAFGGIVVNPARVGGQPTFAGRRVSIATIAGMVKAGERPEDLAGSYGLSLMQVDSAVRFARRHKLAA